MAFSNAKQLRTLAEALCELVQDVNLVVTREGLSVQAIDVSHVCLVSVTLAAADMARFEGADDGTVVLGIHVPNLLCALKLGGAEDEVTMEASGGCDSMALVFSSPDGSRTACANLRLMEIDHEQFGITEFDDAMRFDMSSKEFARVVRDLASVGDTVGISMDAAALTMSCSSDIGTASIRFTSGAQSEHEHEHEHETVAAAQNFSLKHMVSISKAVPLCEIAKLEMPADKPLSITFAMSPSSRIRYHLAPKINPDE